MASGFVEGGAGAVVRGERRRPALCARSKGGAVEMRMQSGGQGVGSVGAAVHGLERRSSRTENLAEALRSHRMVADAARRNLAMSASVAAPVPGPAEMIGTDGSLLSVDALRHAVYAAADKLVVVKFYAPWCRACRSIGKQLEKVRGTYGSEVEFYEVSFESAKDVFRELEISAMPTIHFYHLHEKIDDFSVGPARARVIGEKIDAFVQSHPQRISAE